MIIHVCRKPLVCNNVAENVLRYQSGGLNIDPCRIDIQGESINVGFKNPDKQAMRWKCPWMNDQEKWEHRFDVNKQKLESLGRYPANLILTSQGKEALDREVGYLHTRGNKTSMGHGRSGTGVLGWAHGRLDEPHKYYNAGFPSRFFKCVE